MDGILRALAIYLVLFILFRLFGNRMLSRMTPFDLLLLLIVGEAAQQALLGENFSITQAFLVIATLLAIERGLDLLAWRFPKFRRFLEGRPLVLMVDGRMHHDAMNWAQVSEDDLRQEARVSQGLESLDQVKHAVLETRGGLSIIPKRGG